MKGLRSLLIAACLCSSSLVFAQTTDKDVGKLNQPLQSEQLDFHIDAWSRGTITAIDVANAKLSINGIRMPYASAYAKMLREIHEQTADITDQTLKQKKETDLRQSWMAKLDASKQEAPGKEGSLEFRFPPKVSVSVLPEAEIAKIDYLVKDKELAAIPKSSKDIGVVGAPMLDTPKASADIATNLSLSDLKVGDAVLVGFDSGLIHNDSYAIIRTTQAKPAEVK
jgi:hypothetical protein